MNRPVGKQIRTTFEVSPQIGGMVKVTVGPVEGATA